MAPTARTTSAARRAKIRRARPTATARTTTTTAAAATPTREPRAHRNDAMTWSETIVPCRSHLSDRFPVASFLVRVPSHRVFEVACATDPRLFQPAFGAWRTPATFFSSAWDGLLRGGNDHRVFLLPADQLQRFA